MKANLGVCFRICALRVAVICPNWMWREWLRMDVVALLVLVSLALMATAGAGDVLAGLIAGLAASEVSGELFNMAEVAVWLHVEAARAFGAGLIAEDLVDILPEVLRAQLA